ncbi:hypothetical protein BC831DRAFT_449688, partial [Entophlyctis helioformis]
MRIHQPATRAIEATPATTASGTGRSLHRPTAASVLTAMAKMDTTDGRCMRTDLPRQCCAAPALLLPKQNSAVAS